MKKNKNKFSSKQLFSVITAIVTLLAYLMTFFLVMSSHRYMALSANTFLAVGLIFVAILFALTIIFYVGYAYRDNKIKIVNLVLSFLLLIISTVGSFYIYRINRTVNKVTENSGTDQYEEIGVSISTMDDNITSIADLNGKTVGVIKVFDSSVPSATSLGQEYFESKGITVIYKEFTSNNDLYLALVSGEGTDKIDAAIFRTGYRTQFASIEGYESYLDEIRDIETFSQRVKIGENKSANLDLASNPFSILLIGMAEEAGGGGLPDAIILATVNPKTMTVSMVSIARDSYVEIPCRNNAKNKINDTGTDRSCLMQSVSHLLNTDIDLYMQVNFEAVVEIVDALGGIWIDSPVEFVGQSSSVQRGNYTVWVGKGGQTVNGEQALAFARERHAMPNGDFDRQQHQKEVIAQIVEKMMALKDVNKALQIMEIAGDNFKTNLSRDQLISVFNYLVTAKNYTGLSNFDMIDIQNLRITGYSSWFYSMSARLPLWIYRLYNGSIKETEERIDEVLGEYDEIQQDYEFKFFYQYPYQRPALYSESFDEAQIHEEMPAFVPHLTSMTLAEAQEWASSNGVNLVITYIGEGDDGYDATALGSIISQDVRYGALVSDYPTVHITVMGAEDLSDENKLPNFVGWTLSDVEQYCAQNNITVTLEVVELDDVKNANKVIEQSVSAGSDKRKVTEIKIKVYETKEIDIDSLNLIGLSKEDATKKLEDNGLYASYIQAMPTGTFTDGQVMAVDTRLAKIGATVKLTIADSSLAPTPTPSIAPTPTPSETMPPTPVPTTSPEPEQSADPGQGENAGTTDPA